MNRQRRLGQYFTPPAIARAMVNLARPYLSPDPVVADLACGEAVLLATAIEQGITLPERVYGTDIDPHVQAGWAANELLRGCHLSIQDGLAFDPKAHGLAESEIDLAIGNPPFNRAQDRVSDPETLKRFKLGRRPLKPAEEAVVDVSQMGFEFREGRVEYMVRVYDHMETVVSQPIEALFLEKFVQLTRPGGIIVIILPEGLLSNEGSQDLRDFMVDRTDVLAIIGLPRRLFDNDAKTSIVLLRKKEQPGRPQREPVFLAALGSAVRNGDMAELDEAVARFRAGPVVDSHALPSAVRETLLAAEHVFYVTHSATAWQAHPPERWAADEFRPWIGGNTEPRPGDLLLVYRFPAKVEGAGVSQVHRIAGCQVAGQGERGYYLASEPWLVVSPPISYRELGHAPGVESWNAYRAHFRGWARGGPFLDDSWKAVAPMLLDRLIDCQQIEPVSTIRTVGV